MMAIDNCCRKYRCTWLTTAKRYHHPHCGFSSKKVQIFSLCVSSNTTNLSLLIKIFGIQSNSFRYSHVWFFLLCGEIFRHTAHCISQQRKQRKQVFCSFCLLGFFFTVQEKFPTNIRFFFSLNTKPYDSDS